MNEPTERTAMSSTKERVPGSESRTGPTEVTHRDLPGFRSVGVPLSTEELEAEREAYLARQRVVLAEAGERARRREELEDMAKRKRGRAVPWGRKRSQP